MNDITRLDFTKLPDDRVLVNKIFEDHQRRQAVVVNTVMSSLTLDELVSWCESTGWTVRRWPGGARAWWGGLRPVRTAGAIKNKRAELMHRPIPGLQVHALDLAYDL